MNFHGFCSYPHGGWPIFGLITSCIVALSSTMYGMATCRFLYIDFQSDRGDFGEFYLDPTPDGVTVTYRAAAGLYSWLVPFDETDWSQGRCAGYNDLQRETFGNNLFEVARIFGILSVLGGMAMTVWTLFLACLSLRRYQIFAMSLGLFLLTCFVALTFMLFQSQLCKDLIPDQDESYTTECTLDQGGLVAVAGAIMWFVAFLISVIHIKSPENDIIFLERERQQTTRRKLADQRRVELEAKRSMSKSSAYFLGQEAISTGESVDWNDDGTAEVQIGYQRGRAVGQ